VITWESNGQDGDVYGIYGKRLAANGAEITIASSGVGGAVGNEFRANSYSTNQQRGPAVIALADGGFITIWHSNGQDGSGFGIYGKRFNENGAEISLISTEQPSGTTELPTSDSEIPTSFSESTPQSKAVDNNEIVYIIAAAGVCCLTAVTAGTIAFLIRKHNRKGIIRSNVANANDVAVEQGDPLQMSHFVPKENLFQSVLQSYELYDSRFRLLTTINSIVSKEISDTVWYQFSLPKNMLEVSGIIDSGQFGETLFAFDSKTQQFVLCKVVRGKIACENSKQEAEIHQLVSNKPGIIELIRFGDFTQGLQADVRYVHFLEYANLGDGLKLRNRLSAFSDEALRLQLAIEIVHQLLTGLSTLKKHGVYHADLKLKNFVAHINVTEDGQMHLQIKLIDFGCAQILEGGMVILQDSGEGRILSLQRINFHKAQRQGLSAKPFNGHAEDMWALGLIAFELTSKHDPKPVFDSRGLVASLQAQISVAEFENRKATLPALPDDSEIKDVISDQMLAIDAEKRSTCDTLRAHGLFQRRMTASEHSRAMSLLINHKSVATSAKVDASKEKPMYYRNGQEKQDQNIAAGYEMSPSDISTTNAVSPAYRGNLY